MTRESMREIQRLADRVCVLILSSDLPAIDIEIKIEQSPRTLPRTLS